jgi:hypothetical protein
MPDFYVDDIEIEPYEFVRACSKSEIKELITELTEEGHLPKSVLVHESAASSKRGVMELEFIENLEKLKEKYYSLTLDEEQTIQEIFKKHL